MISSLGIKKNMYVCVAHLGANYFGIGFTKEQAYHDLHNKWANDAIVDIPSEWLCVYLEVVNCA